MRRIRQPPFPPADSCSSVRIYPEDIPGFLLSLIHILKFISVLLVITMIIFYGIFQITMMSRRNPYGILRAIGDEYKRQQLQLVLEQWLY